MPIVKGGSTRPSTGDDTLTGTTGNDTISALAGNDTISGLAGDDTLSGDAGADHIDGGAGNDVIFSGSVSPSFQAGAPLILDHGTEVDTLLGASGNDVIFAGYGDNADGGSETDGSGGNDTLYVSFQGATSGVNFDFHLATQVIGGGTITGFENLAYVEGSNFDDTINAGSNYSYDGFSSIYGMGGNDTIIAGYTTRLIDGGDGSDIIDGRGSQYLAGIDGGSGDDTIYASPSPTAVINGGDGNDTIYSGSETHGGDGDDTIILAYNPWYNSEVTGDAGDDTIIGNSSADNIAGNDGADHLDGGLGNDKLDGGAGDDFLIGGAGDDGLTGGSGNDTFQFQPGDGHDVITDFAAGDIISIDGYASATVAQDAADVVIILSSSDRIVLSNADAATVEAAIQFAPAEDRTIEGTSGNDRLLGSLGNDVIHGGDGGDVIAGGAGADVIDGGNGFDLLYSGNISTPWEFPYYGIPYTAPALDHGTEVDTLSGGAGDDTILAGYGDNVDGGENGSAGDTLYISFQGATAGVTADFTLSSQAIGGGTISGIESVSWVEGSNFDDYIKDGSGTGYGDGAVILGMGGNDALIAGYYTQLMDGGDGNDVIDGRGGQYLQELDGGAGDDTIYAPDGLLTLNGGSGNDLIYGAYLTHGGTGDDTIFAHSVYGARVFGDAGNDTITAGTTDDEITGGTGDDTLTGGGGNDTFFFDGGDGKDVITDFSAGDTVRVAVYDSAESITQVGSDVIVVFSADDQVTFQNTDVATVQAGLVFTPAYGQYVGGTNGDDTLQGGSGNDNIAGLGGSDTIDGGAGDDHLDAGTTGVDAEHDVLTGGAGDDWLRAGFGDDADGGVGSDTLVLNLGGATAGVTLDTALLLTGTTIGGGTIQNFESLESLKATDWADTLTVSGNVERATVDAGGGSDTITVVTGSVTVLGGAGNDTLTNLSGYTFFDGGDGDDFMIAGAGIDAFSGGDGTDTIDYRNATAGVSVDLDFGNGPGGDSYLGVENVNGSAFNDVLTGSYVNNALRGGDGDDVISGGQGNDTMEGGSGNDTFNFAKGDGQDVVTDFTDGDQVAIDGYGSVKSITQSGADVVVILSATDQITFLNTDIATVQAGLHLAADPPVNLTGTAGNDILTGGSGNDTLSGLAGNDTLDGGAGADTLMGGLGNDIYIVDDAGDQVIEARRSGTDEVRASVSYTLAASQEIEKLVATSDAGAIALTGNEGAQTITGNDSANVLSGLAGNDTINGLGGDDIISGGFGNDILTGGSGADTFVFEPKGGNDRITDFVSGADKLDLRLLHTDMSAVKETVNRAGDMVISVDANHDGRADFMITLTHVTHVDASDFIFV